MQRINTKTLNKTLPITPNTKKAKLIAILKQWLKENVQGKYLIASDGKKIHFNSNKSVKHIAFDGSSSFLVAQTIPYIVDVFTLGQALGREELKKERKDEFIAFHSYEKTIKIGKYEVKLRAKAGELASGNIEVLPSLIAYTQYILSKKIITDDSSIAVCKNLVEYSKEQPIDYATSDNVVDNNLLIDSKQDDFTFEILAINEIVRDDTMQRINTKSLDKTLDIPAKYTRHDLIQAVKKWFTKNHLNDDSRYVLTANNQKIYFTGISEWHLTFDATNNNSKIVALALTYLPEVFESGQYKSIQNSNKDRSNKRANFVCFHIFTKKVKIGNYSVKIRAKAGEYPNGKIILLPKLSAYTFTAESKKIKSVATNLLKPTPHHSNTGSATHQLIKSISDSVSSIGDSTLILDGMQDDFTFEILAINEIVRDDTMQKFNEYLKNWGM